MLRNRFWVTSPGVAYAIAAPLLYSATIPLSKVFLHHVDPWMLAGLLDLSAGLGIGLLYVLRWGVRQKPAKNSLKGSDWKWLWSSIFAGGLFAPVLQAFGIANSTAASASLLLNLEGVFTALIAWFVFRETFRRGVAWGLVTITAGSVVLIGSGDTMFNFSWGSLAVVGACLCWATTSNLTHKVSTKDPLQVVVVKTFVSGSFNVTLALALGNALPNLPVLGAIAITGLICIGLTFICFIMALRHLGTSRAGTFFSLFPFSGAILAVVALDEPVTLPLTVAAGLMALGLWFCLRAGARPE